MQYDHWKKVLEKHFSRCNLEIDIRNDRGEAENLWGRRIRNFGRGADPSFAFDILRNQKGEKFILFVDNHERIKILSYRPETRHVVLAVESSPGILDRLLCGHDEREYFIANLPSDAQITTVEQAIESLKRVPVTHAERRGEKVLRQGEWDFIPAPEDFSEEGKVISQNEPLVRRVSGRAHGTPHIAQEAIREGRRTVEVGTGRFDKEGNELMRVMTEVDNLYVRGTIRHPDHKTLKLQGWHHVVMNREFEGRWNAGVTFLD